MNQTETQTNNPWLAMPNEAAEFETLEPGSYNGVCIGCIIREFPNYNDRNLLDRKVQFIFQIVEGGQQYYLRSKPCKIVINEKSNLYLLVNSWTKATLERMTNGFACNKMVGYGAQIVTTTREANGKTYADIANILPLKKGVKVQVTPAEIPAFLAKGALEQVWADGITVKEEPHKAATFPAGNAAGTVAAQPPVQKMPQMPANAQVTQNADPAGFMGGTDFTVTVAAPVPDMPQGVVTAEQALKQEGLDDADDLPFN